VIYASSSVRRDKSTVRVAATVIAAAASRVASRFEKTALATGRRSSDGMADPYEELRRTR
jgi:hypothetical protein